MCIRYAINWRQVPPELLQRVGDVAEESKTRIEIFSDCTTPIVRRNSAGKWQTTSMRWGMPPPPKSGAAPIINLGNLKSPYWRAWLGPENRCLVPFTEFSESEDASPENNKRLRWFSVKDRPIAMFAGIYCTWIGARGPKTAPEYGQHLLYAFLTTEANDVVRPIHAEAMPVILETEAEWEHWLTMPAKHVRLVQKRLFPAEHLLLQGG